MIIDFMNMTGVAELLRKSGAFFIRRRFGNDILYWAIISEYVRRTIMHGGHPMEIFVEGTRSRTGKSLSPKTGKFYKYNLCDRHGRCFNLFLF